mgnify:CR=1 FL=1
MYLFLPNNVFAQTRCRNEWYTSDATASKEIILLSTGNDDNVLTETNSSSLSLAFAKKSLKELDLMIMVVVLVLVSAKTVLLP